MKILAVDDEKLMLLSLELAIREAVLGAEVFAFSKSSEALDFATNNKTDVAFLDIQMPGINGLELARRLLEIDPEVNIIFCTGYDDYISEAFRDVRCNGYITKPVEKNQIWQEMQHLRVPMKQIVRKAVRFQCFGNFEVFINDKLVDFERAKTKELLAYLVNANGALCSNHEIITNLWEDDENHGSYFKKLRKDLVDTLANHLCDNILIWQRGMLGIDTSLVDCDYYEWKKENTGRYDGEYMKQYLWSNYWG